MATTKVKILDSDLSREAGRMVKPKNVVIRPIPFRVSVGADKGALDEMDKDARFVAKLYDDATKSYKTLVGHVALKIKRADDLAGIMPLTDQEKRDVTKEIDALCDKYRKEIGATTEKHFAKWKQVRKDRKAYKFDVAFEVGKATVSVGGGAAAAVTSGGVAWLTGMYGVVKGLARLVREYKRVAQEVDDARAKLQKTIAYLQTSYTKRNPRLKEIGASAVKTFLEYDAANVKRAEKELITFKGKLAKVDMNAGELGKGLNKLLDEQGKVNKKIAEIEQSFKKRKKKSKALDKMNKKIGDSAKQVQDLIKQIEDQHARIEKLERFGADAEKAMTELRQFRPLWVKGVQGVISFAGLIAAPAATLAAGGEVLGRDWDAIKDLYDEVAKEMGAS